MSEYLLKIFLSEKIADPEVLVAHPEVLVDAINRMSKADPEFKKLFSKEIDILTKLKNEIILLKDNNNKSNREYDIIDKKYSKLDRNTKKAKELYEKMEHIKKLSYLNYNDYLDISKEFKRISIYVVDMYFIDYLNLHLEKNWSSDKKTPRIVKW